MNKIWALAFTVVALLSVNAIGDQVIDLAAILGNSGFEDDSLADQWTATKKSTNYRLDAPVLDPIIVPKGANYPLEAPVGYRFIGVQNPGDDDINGRLVHDVVAGPFPADKTFTITLFGNRGRLSGAPSPLFPNVPSELTLQFFGWKVGAYPFVDPSSDNWSRTPTVVLSRSFTNWAANGEWAVQTFQFSPKQTLQYISLSVTVKNHKASSYVAFDILPPPAP
jgi:hypothetical protein